MRQRVILLLSATLAVSAAGACASSSRQQGEGPTAARPTAWQLQVMSEFARRPPAAPERWLGLLGEYGPDTITRWYVLERDERLWILDQHGNYVPLSERSDSIFEAPRLPVPVSGEVRFHLDSTGRAASVQAGDAVMRRRTNEPAPGEVQLKIPPVRPVDELRRAALAATPPPESGSFRPADLVEVTTLDSTIRLDIRYAGENNFLATKIYEQPRAFLQRPAAEAVARGSATLRPLGYGLLIHDAYRPWYVTKIFWDAVPEDKRWAVANPAEGSRHNRGAAVDITLYDLETGKPADMPSTYDEITPRAHSTYPAGTSLQRFNRTLLRRVLEHEGFTVFPLEWWHFDYKDWRTYPILNVPFDRLARGGP